MDELLYEREREWTTLTLAKGLVAKKPWVWWVGGCEASGVVGRIC